MIISSFFSRSVNNAISLVYPALCVLCDQPRRDDSAWFCPACLGKFARNNASRDPCPLCGQDLKSRSCTCRFAWDHFFERAHALFNFDDDVKHAVHEIKYRGRGALGIELMRRFCNVIPAGFFDGMDGVMGMPIHFMKKLSRGYNQAAYLARGVMRGAPHPLANLDGCVKRTRQTRTQTYLDREERRRNLQTSFVVTEKGKKLLPGKNVILVDDVVTTGASTDAVADVLLKAGCGKVRVLCLARD